MSSKRKRLAAAVCLALTLMTTTGYAKDFTVALPVQENAAVPAAKDDFYLHVNTNWLKTTKIPADEGSYNHFVALADKTRGQLTAITKEAIEKQKQHKATVDEARVADLYACIVDQKGREAVGLGKLAEPLHRIEAVKTTQEYAETMADLSREYGLSGVMVGSFGIANNPVENDRYVVFLSGPSTGFSREFMENDANAVYHGYYRDYMRDLLVQYGRSPEAATKTAADIFAMQKDIALHSLTAGELRDPAKSTHHLKLQDLEKLYSNLDIVAMLNKGGVGPANGVQDWYVDDLGAIARFNELCTPENLPILKEHAVLALLKRHDDMLTAAYQKIVDRFSQQISGAAEGKSTERKIEEQNESILSNTYGRLYAARYFSEERRSLINGYLKLILSDYKQKINKLDWMSEATKAQAIKKLDHMDIHVGTPAAWPDYMDQYVVVRPEKGGSLIDNVLALEKLVTADNRSKLGKPIRKDLWEGILPQEVNAFYAPQNNSINFPAAILQEPFFDPKADQATNLGGIGAVMAHEITHSFDSGGAQYDEQGRLHNWWTDQDYAEFKKRQANVIKFYDRYVLTDGTRLNGTQTLTENIADLGALSCVTEIVGQKPEELRRLYTNYAVIWQSKESDASLRFALTDVHSLDYVRVNAVLSSTDGFYEAFGVQPGDGMYVAPEERAKIW